MKLVVKALLLSTIACLTLCNAHAQAWPTKPVKFILSQPAGAGPDVMARFVA